MKKLINNLKKKTKLKIYHELRKFYLKDTICNIGQIIENEDKIICYVNQKSIDKYKDNKPIYKLILHGMEQLPEHLRKNYNLNKPVYYIFDGLEFNTGLEIGSLASKTIFRNCTFTKNIGILWGNEINFENNKYNDNCCFYYYGECFLTATAVKKINFINDNFVNSYKLKQYGNARFGMKINAEEVNFINTKTDVVAPATINIKAEKTKIENSTIKADEIYLDSQSINSKESSIISPNGVIIENADWDFKGHIQSSIVFYNGTDLANNIKDIHEISKEEINLKESRKKLIAKLRNLSNYCQQINDNKIRSIKDNLNHQPISKTLKKGNYKH